MSGGAQAADLLIQAVADTGDKLNEPIDCCRLLKRIDLTLYDSAECGETTGIVLVINEIDLFGASVGDSAVWTFSSSGADELTIGQIRKPLLGSGEARPCSFKRNWSDVTLVAATDGLWKYVRFEALRECILTTNGNRLAEELVALASLKSGAYSDDVAVVTCNRGARA